MKVTVGYDVILTSVIDTKQECLNLGISIDWLMMDLVTGWLFEEGVCRVCLNWPEQREKMQLPKT